MRDPVGALGGGSLNPHRHLPCAVCDPEIQPPCGGLRLLINTLRTNRYRLHLPLTFSPGPQGEDKSLLKPPPMRLVTIVAGNQERSVQG